MSPETVAWVTERMAQAYTRITSDDVAQDDTSGDDDE